MIKYRETRRGALPMKPSGKPFFLRLYDLTLGQFFLNKQATCNLCNLCMCVPYLWGWNVAAALCPGRRSWWSGRCTGWCWRARSQGRPVDCTTPQRSPLREGGTQVIHVLIRINWLLITRCTFSIVLKRLASVAFPVPADEIYTFKVLFYPLANQKIVLCTQLYVMSHVNEKEMFCQSNNVRICCFVIW